MGVLVGWLVYLFMKIMLFDIIIFINGLFNIADEIQSGRGRGEYVRTHTKQSFFRYLGLTQCTHPSPWTCRWLGQL